MNYLLLFIASFLLAVDFAVNKLYQKTAGTGIVAGLGFNSILGLFTAIIFLAANGFKCSVTVFSLVMATIFSILVMSYNIIGFRILKNGSMAVYTLFLMTGGMIVPYIYGLLFLDEMFSWIRTCGILLIIFAVILSNFSKEKIDKKQILMCILVFVINGFTSVVSKVHQIEIGYETVSTNDFVILVGVMKLLVAGIAYLAVRVKSNRASMEKKSNKLWQMSVVILTSAIVSGVSFVLQLRGAQDLPASVLYPFLTGGTMVLSSIVGVIVFKEVISKKTILSVCLCFVGTLLFL